MKDFIIKIISLFQGQGAKEAEQSLNKVDRAAGKTKRSTGEMSGEMGKAGKQAGLLAGVVGGVTVAALNALQSAVTAAAQALIRFGIGGIEFNAKLQTARIGIAAVLRQFDDTGKFGSFGDAMKASAEAIERLKRAAAESPATFDSLVTAFQSTAGAAAAANLNVEDHVALVVRLSQVLSTLGIPEIQMTQELRALLTGTADQNAQAASVLFGSSAEANAQIRAAKEQGRLMELYNEKTASYGEGAEVAAGTVNQLTSNLKDFEQLMGQVLTSGVFEEINKDLASLLEKTKDPALVGWAKSLSVYLEGAYKGIKLVTDKVAWVAEHSLLGRGFDLYGKVTGLEELAQLSGANAAGSRAMGAADDIKAQIEGAQSIKELTEITAKLEEQIAAARKAGIEESHAGVLQYLETLKAIAGEREANGGLPAETETPQVDPTAAVRSQLAEMRDQRERSQLPARDRLAEARLDKAELIGQIDAGLEGDELQKASQRILELQKEIWEIEDAEAKRKETQREQSAELEKQLDLEARLAEARASGDESEQRKLQWLERYNALLAEGAAEWQARRVANAESAEPGAAETPAASGPNLSNIARAGGAVGESLAAARQAHDLQRQQVDIARKSHDHLAQIARNTTPDDDFGDRPGVFS